MKKIKSIALIAVLFVVVIFSNILFSVTYAATNDLYTFTITGLRDYEYAEEIFNLTNVQRKANGLNGLSYDKDLTAAAMKRAEEIALNYSHTRPDGTRWFTVSPKADAENIATGYEIPGSTIKAWMNSEGHRKNILGGYKSMGVGVFYCSGTLYWVQLFSRKDSETAPTETGITDYYQTDVTVLSNTLGNLFIEYDNSDLTVAVGEKMEVVNAYIENCAYAGKNISFTAFEKDNATYTSSNPNVATVDNNGTVYGRSAGTVNITAKVADTTSTYKVKVVKNGNAGSVEELPSEDDEGDDTQKPTENEENKKPEETTKPDVSKYQKGDLNKDGKVNAADATRALEIFKNGNPTEEELLLGDMDGRNGINANDATMIIELFKNSGI